MDLWMLFEEGGWGMYPTLVLGLVTLVASARFAWMPHRTRLAFVIGMWASTLAQIAHSTLTDLAAVFRALANQPVPDPRILLEGLKECTRPGILGGVFLVLALVLVSIGLQRTSTRAEA
jgi:hypothetical protein